MEYLIIPEWLNQALEENGLDHETLLNGDRLLSILSEKEFSFYIQANMFKWHRRIYRTASRDAGLYQLYRHLMERLYYHCSNVLIQQSSKDSRISNLTDYAGQIDTMDAMVNGPLAGGLSNADLFHSHMLWFKPVLVGKSTLGLIPKVDNNCPERDTLREVYETLHHFMTVDEIIKSPLAGI